MKFIATLFFILLCSQAQAQLTHLQWTAKESTTNASGNQTITSATDNQGNTFEIQETQSNISFYITNRFICYDINGNKKWEYINDSCNGTCAEKYNCIIPQGNGAAIFIGYGKLKKINGNGNFVWQHTYSNTFVVKPIEAKLDKNGDVIVAFDVDGISTGNDFSVAKFSKFSGTELWWSTIPDAGTNGDILYETISGIDIDNNNAVYAIGTAGNTFAGIFRLMLCKWDSSGSIKYSNIIESNFINFNGAGNRKIKVDQQAAIYTAYDLQGAVILKKFSDSNAVLEYSKVLKKDSSFTRLAALDYVHHKIYILNNYSYQIADTSFQGFYETNKKYYVEKIDTSSSSIWQKFYLNNFDVNAIPNGFGGAMQMIHCDNKFSISSIMNKTIAQPYLIINRIDTSGTQLWYDSNALDVYPIPTLSTDAFCNTYLTYSIFNGGAGLKSITQKYTDILNFPQAIQKDKTLSFEVIYQNNSIVINTLHDKIGSLQLYTIDGKLIFQKHNLTNHVIIPTQDVAQGLYIIKVVLNNSAASKKIFIN